MKIQQFLFTIVISLAVQSAMADEVIRIVQLHESGTLDIMLGDKREEIDSIVISGPMNNRDWECLRQCCMNGRLHGVDLTEVTAENDSMPDMALGHMTSWSILKNIRLPQNLRAIGPRALKWCTSLEFVVLPQTLKTIGKEAFYNCTSLRHIDLPQTLELIDKFAFYLTALETIDIPQYVHSLGYYAFGLCENLKQASLPAKVQLGERIFSSCVLLSHVQIPSDLEAIPKGMFADCESLKFIKWPASLQMVGDHAFESCPMKNIILPDGVHEIGAFAFSYNNNLTTLVLPADLTTFYQTALVGSGKQLQRVYCKSTVPPTTVTEAYYQTEINKSVANTILCVPTGCGVAYLSAPYWKDFAGIKEVDMNDIPTGIDDIDKQINDQSPKYSLDGRIKTTGKGIYIHNGKKYLKEF